MNFIGISATLLTYFNIYFDYTSLKPLKTIDIKQFWYLSLILQFYTCGICLFSLVSVEITPLVLIYLIFFNNNLLFYSKFNN